MISSGKTYRQRRIFFDGNSLGNYSGGIVANGQRYVNTCVASLRSAGFTNPCFNYAIGGRTTQELTAEFFTKFATAMLAPNDIVVLWEISNDAHNLVSDTAGTALHANVIAYCNQAKGAGAKVVVVTGIARDYPSYDDANITDRIFACNALIRSNYTSYADRLADPALLPQFDSKADTLDATYYQTSDRAHLTDAGYDLIAPPVFNELQWLLLNT